MDIHKGLTVGVLMGGLSDERDVSLTSGRAVAKALRERGWKVVEIDVGRDVARRLVEEGVDVAWLALHGRFGEDGCIQGTLELMGIPYTGSGVRASAVAMDKVMTKRLVQDLPEVTVARDAVVGAGDPLPTGLGFPLLCKTPKGGSTLGIHRVTDEAGLQAAVTDLLERDDVVLVEEFVTGDEITVAVIEGEAYPIVRIVPDSGYFDFEAKYTKGRTTYEVPAQISAEAWQAAQVAAVAVYETVGCRGLARADFIIRADQTPVLLEINTIPGMTPTSLSPMAAGEAGMSYGELCERLLLGAALTA